MSAVYSIAVVLQLQGCIHKLPSPSPTVYREACAFINFTLGMESIHDLLLFRGFVSGLRVPHVLLVSVASVTW